MAAKTWTAIVATSQDDSTSQCFLKELKIRQKKGYIPKSTLLLSVPDPRCKVGSGGATLNALLVVAEHLSALSGYTVVTSDVLRGTSILLIHVGVHFPFTACQRGFVTLPAEMAPSGSVFSHQTGLTCTFDVYLNLLTNKIAPGSPPGLWVSSMDRILCVPNDAVFNWDNCPDVKIFTVAKELQDTIACHGACNISGNGEVIDIIYDVNEEEMRKTLLPGDKVPTICGVIYMKNSVAETLLSLHVRAPLDACTYLGLDSAAKPVKNLSLFYDMLLAMATGVEEREFVEGRRSGNFGMRPQPLDDHDKVNRKLARKILWDALKEYKMKAVHIVDGDFHYMYARAREIHDILSSTSYRHYFKDSEFVFKNHIHSIANPKILQGNNIVINSIIKETELGDATVVCNSEIQVRKNIFGNRCLILNIKPEDLRGVTTELKSIDDLVIQSLTIKIASRNSDAAQGRQRVMILFGLNDDLCASINDPKSTFCNQPWDMLFDRTEITRTELWNPDIAEKNRCLMNARLFPVFNPNEAVGIQDLLWLQGSYQSPSFLAKWRSSWRLSIAEILAIYDAETEFTQRRKMYFEIGKLQTEDILMNQRDECLLPFFRFCILEGFFEEMLKALDSIASRTTCEQRAVLSRTLACIADVIGSKADGRGGLRSGPAANVDWQHGIVLLKDDKIVEAISCFAEVRKAWFSRPDFLVRSARHYEGAFQVQVSKAVGTARQFINLKSSCEPSPMGQWIIAEAPARVDIAGTWSDTPPICYEHGGSVITAGVKIDGKKPIGCRVRRIPQAHVILILGKGENSQRIVCKELDDLCSYTQVHLPGTVLKAAFFCAGILTEKSYESLKEQLLNRYKGGFELQTWSDLPHGSGLGTSSILSGTILAALWKAVGKEPDVDSAIHAVLDLEQMITTGGGWQDNVGGLCPGIKEGSSRKGLPLQVISTPIAMPDGFMEKFEKHLILIFSGKTRLARNMLQDVLRNWNARLPEIVKTADELVDNAKNCIAAFNQGNLEKIGACMDRCWEHKKLMAPGCEPKICKQIIDAIRPISYGQCLAGAGGGGFMYVITKRENAVQEVREKLAGIEEVSGKATAHAVHIDLEGLTVRLEH